MRTSRVSAAAVPVIGQGTWQIEHDEPSAVNALRRGLELGMSHIDTAEMYGSGRAEEIVGRAIAGRRSEVYLASKVLPSNASRRGTKQACERSLTRLGTDHLDLYLLHWPSSHPLSETLAAFVELEEAGKIRAFGVSNFDVDELRSAVELVGAERIACNQILYHLRERTAEHRIMPWCREQGIAVVAYSPFGQGDFPEPGAGGEAQVLSEVARTTGATERQVALAFVLRGQGMLTIPKASRIEHVEENAVASELVLDPEDIAALERAFGRGPAGPLAVL